MAQYINATRGNRIGWHDETAVSNLKGSSAKRFSLLSVDKSSRRRQRDTHHIKPKTLSNGHDHDL